MKTPPRCPDCPTKRAPTVLAKVSRVFVNYECVDCGTRWRADAASGRLIARLAHELDGDATP